MRLPIVVAAPGPDNGKLGPAALIIRPPAAISGSGGVFQAPFGPFFSSKLAPHPQERPAFGFSKR